MRPLSKILRAEVRVLSLLLLLLFLAGCSTAVPGRVPWGSEARWNPSLEQMGRAALDAARDPLTWVPLAGAGIFSIGDLDEELSDWAVDERPLFGRHADDAGDLMLLSLGVSYLGTALAAPDASEGRDWLAHKAAGLGVGTGAFLLNTGLTYGLKELSNRERPNGEDRDSFPSAHSSEAALFATLTAANLDDLPLQAGSRRWLKAGSYTLAAATAWSRIEAEKHFPSDVLAGLALGHFVGAFAQQAFMAPGQEPLALQLDLNRDRLFVGLQHPF